MEKHRRIHAVSFLCVIAISLAARLIIFSGSLPYVQFVDEPFVTQPALKILQTGDLNPHFFRYPSLPIYLTTMGISAGFLAACGNAEITSVNEIRTLSYPFYDPVAAAVPARLLFVAFSVLAVVWIGLLFGELLGYAYAWLGAAILWICGHFFLMSWSYINADILGASFVALTLYLLVKFRDSENIWESVVFPAAAAGLAVACKYNLGVILLPLILSVALHSRPIVRRVLLAVLICGLVFVVVVPFAILDLPSFLNDVGGEIYHYRSEHFGHSVEGYFTLLSMNANYFITQFGWLSWPLLALGCYRLFRFDWRIFVVLASYFAAVLHLMSSQKIYISRNLLSLDPVFAGFCAIGLVVLYQLVRGGTKKLLERWNIGFPPQIPAVAILAVLILAAFPYGGFFKAYDLSPDTRNQAVAWINDNVADGTTVVVPASLGMDIRKFRDPTGIVQYPLKWKSLGENREFLKRHMGAYILKPRYDLDKRFILRHNDPKLLNRLLRVWVKGIKRFKGRAVLENSNFTLPWGDPEIEIGVIEKANR